MTPELKNKWIEDLENGEHQQCKSVLYNGTGYCCLGRLLAVAGATFVPETYGGDYVPTPIDDVDVNDCGVLLSKEGLELFGLTDEQQRRLSKLNDGQHNRKDGDGNRLPDIPPMTFKQIAQVIREEV